MSWSPTVDRLEFAPECVECGNRVGTDGESTQLEDDVYYFCCASCREQFVSRYEELRDAA